MYIHDYGQLLWTERCFFKAGLLHALNGFESDMLVINLDTEREHIVPALKQFHQDLIVRLLLIFLSHNVSCVSIFVFLEDF